MAYSRDVDYAAGVVRDISMDIWILVESIVADWKQHLKITFYHMTKILFLGLTEE